MSSGDATSTPIPKSLQFPHPSNFPHSHIPLFPCPRSFPTLVSPHSHIPRIPPIPYPHSHAHLPRFPSIPTSPHYVSSFPHNPHSHVPQIPLHSYIPFHVPHSCIPQFPCPLDPICPCSHVPVACSSSALPSGCMVDSSLHPNPPESRAEAEMMPSFRTLPSAGSCHFPSQDTRLGRRQTQLRLFLVQRNPELRHRKRQLPQWFGNFPEYKVPDTEIPQPRRLGVDGSETMAVHMEETDSAPSPQSSWPLRGRGPQVSQEAVSRCETKRNVFGTICSQGHRCPQTREAQHSVGAQRCLLRAWMLLPAQSLMDGGPCPVEGLLHSEPGQTGLRQPPSIPFRHSQEKGHQGQDSLQAPGACPPFPGQPQSHSPLAGHGGMPRPHGRLVASKSRAAPGRASGAGTEGPPWAHLTPPSRGPCCAPVPPSHERGLRGLSKKQHPVPTHGPATLPSSIASTASEEGIFLQYLIHEHVSISGMGAAVL